MDCGVCKPNNCPSIFHFSRTDMHAFTIHFHHDRFCFAASVRMPLGTRCELLRASPFRERF